MILGSAAGVADASLSTRTAVRPVASTGLMHGHRWWVFDIGEPAVVDADDADVAPDGAAAEGSCDMKPTAMTVVA